MGEHDGSLTREEVAEMFVDKHFLQILEAFEVNTLMPFDYVWPIIDWNGDGSVSVDELINACLRLRGSRGKNGYQILILQSDLNSGATELKTDCYNLRAETERRCGIINDRLARIEGSTAALVSAVTEEVNKQDIAK